ncbi:hypothetical protein D9M69_571910 [compost metagenome]
MHGARYEAIGQLSRPFSVAKKVDLIGGDGRVERCPHSFPVRKKLIQGPGIEHGTRKYVRANLRALLDHTDAKPMVICAGELHQTARCRKTSGPCAHYDHVKLHRFALHPIPLRNVKEPPGERCPLRNHYLTIETAGARLLEPTRDTPDRHATISVIGQAYSRHSGALNPCLRHWSSGPALAIANTDPLHKSHVLGAGSDLDDHRRATSPKQH